MAHWMHLSYDEIFKAERYWLLNILSQNIPLIVANYCSLSLREYFRFSATITAAVTSIMGKDLGRSAPDGPVAFVVS